MNYLTRAQAAHHAKRSGLRAFRTESTATGWRYYAQPLSDAVATIAENFAAAHDFVHHVEFTDTAKPVLVVTCFKREIKEDIPAPFTVEPITPELWEKPKVKPKRKVATIDNPIDPAHARIVEHICVALPNHSADDRIKAIVMAGVPHPAATQLYEKRRKYLDAKRAAE